MHKTIAVMSTKGGVGKTIVAVNIAKKLEERKYKVGILDADVSSSNVPEMFGIVDKDVKASINRINPIKVSENLKILGLSSVAKTHFVSKTGIEASQIIEDMFKTAEWGDIEYLVIDCPAGSGDETRSIIGMSAESLLGIIIVTLPTHLEDLHRSIGLCNYYSLPLIGVIENQSGFYCENCKKWYEPLGRNRASAVTEHYKVNFLGSIPLSEDIRKAVDKKNSIIPSPIDAPIVKAVDIIEKSEVDEKKISIWKRLRGLGKKIEVALAEKIVSFFFKFISIANRNIDIAGLQHKYKLYHQKVFEIAIFRGTEKVIFSEYFRVRDGAIRLVKNPKHVAMSIYMDVNTFAQLVLRKRDFKECWLSGDISTYGAGSTSTLLFFIQELWDKVISQAGDEIGVLAKKLLNIVAEG